MYAPGDVIHHRYRLRKPIGVGGMGLVFEADDLSTQARVALKLLRPEHATSVEVVARFRREGRVMLELASEHVVRVLDVTSLEDGTPVIVMERLLGRDLRSVLRNEGPPSTARAVEYVYQAALGVLAAHRAGVVHRDLKPHNLFVSTAGGEARVKLIDFGISKLIHRDDGLSTTDLSVLGTPRYMSPEQIRSTKDTGPTTDVWSLGVILFELLTGQAPFQAQTPHGLLAAILSEKPTKLRELRADAPQGLEDVIVRALERAPAERFATAGEFAAALEPYREGPSGLDAAVVPVTTLPPVALPRDVARAGAWETDDVPTRIEVPPAAVQRPLGMHGAATLTGLVPAGRRHRSLPAWVAALLVAAAAAVAGAWLSARSGAPMAEAGYHSTVAPTRVVDTGPPPTLRIVSPLPPQAGEHPSEPRARSTAGPRSTGSRTRAPAPAPSATGAAKMEAIPLRL